MKRTSLVGAMVLSVAALTLFFNSVSGAALPKITLAAPESLLVKAGSDGTSQVKSMLERTRQMKAYSFDSVLYTFKNGKQMALELDYVPLPDALTKAIAEKVWLQIAK